jgi:hypothetical protein
MRDCMFSQGRDLKHTNGRNDRHPYGPGLKMPSEVERPLASRMATNIMAYHHFVENLTTGLANEATENRP